MKFRLFLTALIVGCFGVQSLSAADQKYTGNTPSAVTGASTDNGKILYLYNLGQKKFLDQGGIWGTQGTSAMVCLSGFRRPAPHTLLRHPPGLPVTTAWP